MKTNAEKLIHLFNQVIALPKINVCTDELKGASVLDANILRLLLAEGDLNLKQMAEALQLKPSTLGSAVKRLEKNGMVGRGMNPEDLRSYVISLTEYGKEAILKLYKKQIEIAGELLSGLESGEQKQLIFLLSKMFFGASEESQGKSDGV